MRLRELEKEQDLIGYVLSRQLEDLLEADLKRELKLYVQFLITFKQDVPSVREALEHRIYHQLKHYLEN